MSYCGPRGIPLLHFLGGPPGWTQHDRDAAVAWARHEGERCRDCGTHPSLWDEKQGGDPNALVATVAFCRGCEVRAGQQKKFDQAPEGTYRRGSYVTLTPNPKADAIG